MIRLEAFILALSQHHRLLREIVGNNKGVLTLPSKEDAITSDMIADIIAHIGGEGLANYCRKKFREGYLTGNYKEYDLKAILTELREISAEGKFKETLTNKFNHFVDLAYRLSNPITYKAAKKKSVKKDDNQLVFFPEDSDNNKEENNKDKEKKPRKEKPKSKRRTRIARLDTLADSIIRSEYGDSDDDSYSDDESYGRETISDSEYAYFAGEEVD